MSVVEELKERYESLYQEMVDSKDTKNMMLFGSVMKELMEHVIKNDISFAEKEIDKLESMNWHQYLTKTEAENICKSLDPERAWSFDVWERTLKSLELETERKPFFNKYALWITMNSIHSDHSETIAFKILEVTSQELSSEQMVSIIHALAVDSLLDKDGKYDVRKYFLN